MDLKTNAHYRPPYSYNSLFSAVKGVSLIPKNLKFLVVKKDAEKVVKQELKKHFNFDYSKPYVNQSEFLDPIRQLQSTKIEVFKKDYPFEKEGDYEKFQHMVTKIGGLISGHSRAFKTKYMMTVLLDFKKKSPKIFNKFSLSQWKLFSNALFGKAPTKSNLMLLTCDKKGTLTNYSHLKSQKASKEIIELLLLDYEDEIMLIRSDFEKSCNEFKKKSSEAKATADKVIAGIKKAK